MDTKKILNIVIIALFAITVVLLGLFMFGGEIPNQANPTPVYTSAFLNWAYVLFGIAILAAVIFPIVRLFTRPEQAMRSFIGLGVIVVVVAVAYFLSGPTNPDVNVITEMSRLSLADATPPALAEWSGMRTVISELTTEHYAPDQIRSTLIFSSTILFTMYILFFGAILAIAGTEIYRRVK